MANKHEKYFVEGYFGVWRTVGGRRIFIRDGEPLDKAMKRSGKFSVKPEKTYNNDVTFIGKVTNVDKIEKAIGLELKNKDIILTDERKNHILDRRKEKDFKLLMDSLKENINNFEEILIDKKLDKISLIYSKNHIDKFHVVVISPSLFDENKANSIITCIIMNERKYKRFKSGKIEIT